MTHLDAARLDDLVGRALAEDLGSGDVTAEATVPAEARGRARIVQKQPGVVFGLGVVAAAARRSGGGGRATPRGGGRRRGGGAAAGLFPTGPRAGRPTARETAAH